MTLENAWKEAARHWWERLNEARGEARMWQQATAHACRSVELREKETEAFRAVNHELSLARDKAENERDKWKTLWSEASAELDGTKLAYAVCCAERDTLKARQEARAIEERREIQARFERGAWTPEGKPGGDFAELSARIAEADRKHPRDLHDECVQAFARNALDNARLDLSNLLSWARVLKCEVAEAMYALAAESPERLADELLDVATVALRWRRAILERGTK